MYKIINSKYDNDTGLRVCDVYCDTEDDLPTESQIAYEFMEPGSWAWIGEERTFRTLNSSNEWV